MLINRLQVLPSGDDEWQVVGEIVNRNQYQVINVSVRLESLPGPGDMPFRAQIQVANVLEEGEKVAFEHSFEAAKPADRSHPDVRATVIWTQREVPPTPIPAVGAPGGRVGNNPASQPTPIQ